MIPPNKRGTNLESKLLDVRHMSRPIFLYFGLANSMSKPSIFEHVTCPSGRPETNISKLNTVVSNKSCVAFQIPRTKHPKTNLCMVRKKDNHDMIAFSWTIALQNMIYMLYDLIDWNIQCLPLSDASYKHHITCLTKKQTSNLSFRIKNVLKEKHIALLETESSNLLIIKPKRGTSAYLDK